MKNTSINLGVIKKVAMALGTLNEEVVYVGGAVVSLYVNDPAAEDVRPTKDVDITLQIATPTELESLRETLTAKGFKQSPQDNVVCRFRYEDVLVDVMSTKEVGWAPANPWFGPGFAYLETRGIAGQQIRILSLPYFLASKYTAFKDRGSKDPRTSHDLEDITYILDNRTDLMEEIVNAPADVNKFLLDAFAEVMQSSTMQEAIMANLYYETQTERFEMILNKLRAIESSSQ